MYKKILFLTCILGSLTIEAQPQPPPYLTGGSLYYTYQGIQNQEHVYRFVLENSKKCNDTYSHVTSVSVRVYDKLSNVLIKTVQVPLTSTSVVNLGADSTNLCLVNPPSLCNVVGSYSFEVSLPTSSNGYIVSSCIPGVTRAYNIVNFYEQFFVLATYTAEIPGGNAAVNSSCYIEGNNLIVGCAGSAFSYQFGASDYEGDELRYYLGEAYQAGLNSNHYIDAAAPPPFQTVAYAPGFSGSRPLGANVTLNEQTGLMTGVAPGPGTYMLTLCVGEYRNGVLIATQRKEVMVNITSCIKAAASLLPEYMVCASSPTLQLANLSSPFRINSFEWQISNSNGVVLYSQTTSTISYTFPDTGVYHIKLVINRGTGECVDSTTAIARVYPGLTTAFAFSGTCINDPTSFINNSTVTYGQINYWKWEFGDNVAGNEVFGIPDVTNIYSPTYQYQHNGLKRVQLVVGTTTGCRDTLRKTITILPKPTLIIPVRDTLSCVNDTIQLWAQTPDNGNFSWSPQTNMVNSNSPRPKVAPATTTVYHVTLNNDGCKANDSMKVRTTNSVMLQAMNDTTICQGDAIRLRVVSNGSTYNWTNVPISSAALPNPVVVTNATTLYQVTAFIGKTCLAKDTVLVTTLPYPTVYAGADIVICSSTSAQLSGSTNGTSFAWLPSATLSQTNILNPIVRPLQTSRYILTAIDTSRNKCPKPVFDTVVVTVPPVIRPFASRDTSVLIGQPLQLNASGGEIYRWSPATALSNSNIHNPIAIYNSPTNGIRYTVRISNAAGCIDSAFITVKVPDTPPTVFIPSAFTPNGDGLNDILRPIAVKMQRIDYFNIYDRWGHLVFNTQTIGAGWDGKVKGQIQNTGTYVWVVKAVENSGKSYFQKGAVTLIH